MARRRTDRGFLLRLEAQSSWSQCRHGILCSTISGTISARVVLLNYLGLCSACNDQGVLHKYRARNGRRRWSENANRDKDVASRERILPRLWQSKFGTRREDRRCDSFCREICKRRDENRPYPEHLYSRGLRSLFTSRKPRREYYRGQTHREKAHDATYVDQITWCATVQIGNVLFAVRRVIRLQIAGSFDYKLPQQAW